MNFNLEPGLTAQARVMVDSSNTAMAYGSGVVDVFATPAMIALMEKAAILAVDRHLPPGWVTVGTKVEVKHIAATPGGMNVTASAELLEAEGPKLKFRVEAYDAREKIGEGIHYRYILDYNQLKQRALDKLK